MAEVALIFVTPLIEKALLIAGSFAGARISLAWGLKKHLQELAQMLIFNEGVLQAAEERQESDEAVRIWLQQLSDVAYEAKDVLDEYAYELLRRKVQSQHRRRKQVCTFFSPFNRTVFCLKMAHKIRKINQSLVKIKENQVLALLIGLSELSRPPPSARQNFETQSICDGSKFVGRDDNVSKIVNMLDNMRSRHLLSGISIVGLGGIGKTTLAKSIFKRAEEQRLYDLVAWVCVSENFDERKILRNILEYLDSSASGMKNMDALVKKLGEGLQGKNFLLVLDDVWNENRDKWNSFEACLLEISKTTKTPGNSILVTTRNAKVVSLIERLPMHKHDMNELSDYECWLIIEDTVLRSPTVTSIPSNLKHIGQEIARKCVGLPLVAKVIGGTLGREISTDWWEKIRDDTAWMSKDEDKKILSILKISFDRLPSALKKCFLYCSIFPKDYIIKKDDLVQCWMAHDFLHKSNGSHGTMEDIGNEYFHELLCNSLFQDIEFDSSRNIESCKMHDVVHDLALLFSRGETFIWVSSCNSYQNSTIQHIRHLRVEYDVEVLPTIPRSIAQRLHSLFAHIDVFCSMASNLKSLRSLTLFGEGREKELTASLNKLKHLRYLDASRAHVKAPPQSFSKLYSLQTCKVNSLLKLPDDVANLISLRHLYSCHPLYVSIQFDCVRSKLEFAWYEVKKGKMNDEEVIESFDPQSNLKSLTISCYRGKNFPSWLVSCNNLVELKLSRCYECTCIPSLGLLPSLKVLRIVYLHRLGRMGHKLHTRSQSSGVESLTLFPALKELSVERMRRLKEWVEVDEDAVARGEVEIVFPCLEKLHIANCPELKTWSMGGFSSNHKLSDLVIQDCRNLKAIPNLDGLSSLKRLEIYRCNGLTSLPTGLGSCISLQNLRIDNLPNLISIPNIDRLSSLKKIYLRNCEELTILPTGLGSCISLQKLIIDGMPNLISIPGGVGQLHSLTSLWIQNCGKLRIQEFLGCLTIGLKELRLGPLCQDLEEFPFPRLNSNASLESLELQGWDKLKSLSDQLQHLTTLKKLKIASFKRMEVLPDWLGNLSSLQWLEIRDCPNLTCLPSREAMGRLSNLKSLSASNCPKLRERCANKSGPEWSKISLIPNIRIDDIVQGHPWLIF